MANIVIKLEEKDKLILEYEIFRHQAYNNAFKLLTSDDKIPEELAEKILNKYIDSLSKLKQMSWDLTIKYGHRDVKIINFDFNTSGDLLIVSF